MEYIWVGIGGFVGANLRYILGSVIANRLGSTFPAGTMVINITGALLIGVLLTILTDRVIADPLWRQLIVIGFLGGFTTFSSYTFEAATLVLDGRWVAALFYVIGSNAIGLLACFAGIALARGVGA